MKHLVAAFLLTLFAGLVDAAPVEEMVHFETIDPPIAVSPAQGEVVVQEFFWYGCGHCYEFEPKLKDWLAKKPSHVRFERVAPALNPGWIPLSKAYYALRQLGVEEKVHSALFDALHLEHRSLRSVGEIADFVASLGVDREAFVKVYNSFTVDANVRKAAYLAGRAGVTGVPTMVVQGKFRTDGSLAGSNERMLDVVDALIERITTHP